MTTRLSIKRWNFITIEVKYSIVIISNMLTAILLSSCSNHEPIDKHSEQANVRRHQERIDTADKNLDLQAYADLEKRLEGLNSKGWSLDNYFMAKSRSWLEFSYDQYSENDSTGTDVAAMNEAEVIITQLEAGEQPTFETNLINGASKLRDDLWEKTASLKLDERFRCAEPKVAELEVQLVWAGHEHQQMGWRHSEPYIRIAEKINSQISDLITHCYTIAAETIRTDLTDIQESNRHNKDSLNYILSLQTDTSQESTIGIKKSLGLSVNIFFAFNKHQVDIWDQKKLQPFLTALKRHSQLILVISGHTDPRGDDKYNQVLSQLRADAVSAYFQSKGLVKDRIYASGRGKIREFPLTEDNFSRNRHVNVRLALAPSISPE